VVALHRHFPSDVPGGILVAGAWGFGALAVLRLVEGEGSQPLGQRSSRAAISVK
jgi:membrane-associated phospholipid phosphatase